MKHTRPKRLSVRFQKWLTPAVILLAALLLVLSVGLAGLVSSHSVWLDLTPEGLYSLSDLMVEQCEKITRDIKITFCDDPDHLMSNYQTRYVYVMAKELEQRFDFVTVETCNVTLNPTAVDRYRVVSSSSIPPTAVIVSCGDQYRIYSSAQFWLAGTDDSGNSTGLYSFNGEYKMATAFLSLSAIATPKAYFLINHGERYYVSPTDEVHADLLTGAGQDEDLAAFYNLLLKAGLSVDYLDLSGMNAVPDDCSILIINRPTSDLGGGNLYSFSDRTESEVLDRYISAGNGSVMIFKDPDVSLLNLEQFADKWGISFIDGATLKTRQPSGERTDVIRASYNTDDSTLGYAICETLASVESSPVVLTQASGAVELSWNESAGNLSGNFIAQRLYSDFLYAPDGSSLYSVENGDLVSGDDRRYAVAAISTRYWSDSYSLEKYYSYVFGAASAALISTENLENPAYGNADVFFSLVRYLARTDQYADLALGSESFNSKNMGGKKLVTSELSATAYTDPGSNKDCAAISDGDKVRTAIFVFVPTVAVAVAGVVLFRRRRIL
ncbi:MAG: Gldg family protein [Clostridia bacterium]|nr:Gldg family protein [Clostridia bacterium]MBR5043962.1 Gldg family protein [Clostridia bacterium]